MSRPGAPGSVNSLAEADVPRLRRALLSHYDREGRTLPWRGEKNPYRVWVSEVMLQQTRVGTVPGYYRRWLERFPSVAALASAGSDEVLLAWEGLGYYRRALNLRSAAQVVRERYGGEVPTAYEDLLGLPGVGEYTAGAVASIAFDRPIPAVDGNVRRVLSRLFDVAQPTPSWLRTAATALLDPARPGDWNQALMDLGRTLCRPREPACGACPWEPVCRARASGSQEERPARRARRVVPASCFATAVVVDRRGRGMVVRNPEGGLLGGMWSFPALPLREPAALVERAREAAAQAGARIERKGGERLIAPIRHRFSHLAATYHPVVIRGRARETGDRRWIVLESPEGSALPAAQRRIARAAGVDATDRAAGNHVQAQRRPTTLPPSHRYPESGHVHEDQPGQETGRVEGAPEAALATRQ